MFAVDIRDTKAELLKKTNELSLSLLKKLEELIIDLYSSATERYHKLFKLIDKRLYTPEDLVEMEKIKTNMIHDLTNIQREYDDAYKTYYFLLSIDHFFSENLIFRTEEAMKRHVKFKKDSDEYIYI